MNDYANPGEPMQRLVLVAFIRDFSERNESATAPYFFQWFRDLFCGDLWSMLHLQHPGLAYVISRFAGPTSKITRLKICAACNSAARHQRCTCAAVGARGKHWGVPAIGPSWGLSPARQNWRVELYRSRRLEKPLHSTRQQGTTWKKYLCA